MRTLSVLLMAVLMSSGAQARSLGGCFALDGDTFMCNHEKFRLTNVYAAELNQTGGVQAKRQLQALIASGVLTWNAHGTDRYGRTLVEAYVNGRRIEQEDVGARAGRGSEWHGPRHLRRWRTWRWRRAR